MLNGIKITRRCEWFAQEEKSTEFSLNLDKHCATKSQTYGILFENKEISSIVESTKTLHQFYESNFQQKETK